MFRIPSGMSFTGHRRAGRFRDRLRAVARRGHIARVAASLLVFAICSGCGADDDESAATPFDSAATELIVPAGLGAETRWPRLLDEWSARTGGTFRVAPYRIGRNGDDRDANDANARPDAAAGDDQPPYRTAPAAAVRAARQRASGESALLFFPLTELPELAAAEFLAPIPPDRRQAGRIGWADMLPGLRSSVGRVGSQPAVSPISCPVLVLYYRRDLLEQAGLSPPETWDDYSRLVETLEDWAPGMVAVEPWGPEWRTTTFLARAAAYCKHPENYSVFFDIDTGRPLINNPGFVRALDEARNTRIHLAPESLNYSPADCRRDFFAGRAAITIAFETGPGNPPPTFASAEGRSGGEAARESAAQPAADAAATARPSDMRAGFAPLPGVTRIYYHSGRAGRWDRVPGGGVHRVTLVGFAGLGAAALAPEPTEAAWSLLQELSVENVVDAFPPHARTPTRPEHFDTPEAWVGEEFVGAEAADYVAAVERSLRAETAIADLPVVARDRFRENLGIGLDVALKGGATSSGALNAVMLGWVDLLRQEDPRRVLDSYRRSLGLRPTTPAAGAARPGGGAPER